MHQFVSPENKNLEQITKKEWISKSTVKIFQNPKNAVAMAFRRP